MDKKLDAIIENIHELDKKIVRIETILEGTMDKVKKVDAIDNKIKATQIASGLFMFILSAVLVIQKLVK